MSQALQSSNRPGAAQANLPDAGRLWARRRVWIGFWSPLLSALAILGFTVLLAQFAHDPAANRTATPQRLADSAGALQAVAQAAQRPR